jgi:MFS family permease
MTPAVAAAKFGIEGLGELLGFLMTGFGVWCLVGPPLGGALVDRTHDFRWPAMIALLSAVIALIVVSPLRATESGGSRVSSPLPPTKDAG